MLRGGLERGQAAASAAAALLLVAGCDTTVQETLGLGKRSPDEFQVVRRAPLVVPPDYTLRPPRPGAVGVGQPDPSAEAREILTGEADDTADPVAAAERRSAAGAAAALGASASGGERALVEASPVAADPQVRSKVVADTRELTRLDRRLFLMILDFQRAQFRPGRGEGEVLDPGAEAARLRTARAGGAGGGGGGSSSGVVTTVRTGSAPLPPVAQ